MDDDGRASTEKKQWTSNFAFSSGRLPYINIIFHRAMIILFLLLPSGNVNVNMLHSTGKKEISRYFLHKKIVTQFSSSTHVS